MPAPPGPRAVVVPFAVPPDAKGLGLGLAAFIHANVLVGGENVALAQLHAKRDGDPEGAPLEPVEAFMPMAAWRELQGENGPPPSVETIFTGSFEPPTDGRGLLKILAFDVHTGATRASVEVPLDDDAAGDGIVAAFDELAKSVDIVSMALRDIAGLPWEALESVLKGERAALHDPRLGAPADRLAPLVHLGRAVSDGPDARYPAARLAALALDVALNVGLAQNGGPRFIETARRALESAMRDAPTQLDLVEALAILCLRTGDADAALVHAKEVAARAPERPRGAVLISEILRGRSDFLGALAAIDRALAVNVGEPFLCVERGVALYEKGEHDAAIITWREVLLRHPANPGAYENLARVSLDRKDTVSAQALVDGALGVEGAHPELLRRAIELALATESEGLSRASRVATLVRRFLERIPDDPWGLLNLAQCHAQMGERDFAIARLRDVERLAKDSPLAAEAQRGLLTLREPEVAAEIDAVVRAARAASDDDLDGVATRARRLAEAHDAWVAHYALGLVERRRNRVDAARAAFEAALVVAPGCLPARAELAELATIADGPNAAANATSLPRSVLPPARPASEPPPSGQSAPKTETETASPDAGATVTPSTNPFTRLKDSFARWRRKD